jgi:hypothetical protein
MTEAILAGKKKKEFSLKYGFAIFASVDTIFSWLPKQFFMSKCPGDAGNRDRQQEKPNYLGV